MRQRTQSGQIAQTEQSEQSRWDDASVECEECGDRLYRAGEFVPAGTYLRVDDGSFHSLSLASDGVLPASFDGHIALYRVAAAPCACQLRRGV